MAWRSPWCWVAVLLVLLFVTTHGLRESTSQVEGHEARTTIRSRGGSRFNPKVIEGLETSPGPFSSSSPNPHRSRNVQKGGSRVEDATRSGRIETTTLKSRRDHGRDIKSTAGHSRKSGGTPVAPTNPDRRRVASNFAARKSSKDVSQRGSVGASTETMKDAMNDRKIGSVAPQDTDETRRIGLFRTRNLGGSKRDSSSTTTTTTEESLIASPVRSTGDPQLDATGPSVFSGTTEIPRSRTGRKIQTTLSSRALKLGLPGSGRYRSSRKQSERSSRPNFERRFDNFTSKGKHDIVPSGSESISIDIPLIGDVTARPKSVRPTGASLAGPSEASTQFPSQRKTSLEDDKRGKNRGRSNDDRLDSDSKTTTSPRSGPGRGTSRFSGTTDLDDASEKIARSRNEAGRSGNPGTQIRNSNRNEGTARTRGRGHQTVGPKRANPSSRSSSVERSRNESSDRRGKTTEVKPLTFKKSSVTEERGTSRVKSRAIGDNVTPPTTTVVSVNPTTSSAMPKITEISTQTPITSTKISTDSQQRFPGRRDRADDTIDGKGSKTRGRTTTVTPPGKKLSREDFFNHGLGFRGRKIATETPTAVASQPVGVGSNSTAETPPRGNPGWTLKRKPSYRQEETATTGSSSSTVAGMESVTTSNEIPTSNRVVHTTISAVTEKIDRGNKRPFRPGNDVDKSVRTSKNSKKTSSQSKVNGDFDENDNYPPEFKAKLAQSKNVPVATPRPSLGARLEKNSTRHTRSTSVPSESKDSGENDGVTGSEPSIPTIVSISPISTTPFSAPSINDQSNGIGKKRPITDPEFVARSRQKLESARKMIVRPASNNDAENNFSIEEKKTTTMKTTATSPPANDKIAKVGRKPIKSISSPTNSEQTKISNLTKGFESTKDDTSANKSIQPSTTGKNENKFARINKTNKNEERTESTTSNIMKDKKSLAVGNTPTILSRRAKELPRDGISTTTRRSRSWNSKHIDKNFREPTERSTNRSTVSTTTTRKSRAWNAPYIDRNWQEPTTKSASTEATPRITKSLAQSISVVSTEKSRIQALPLLAETESTEATFVTTENPGNRFASKKTEAFETIEKSVATHRPVKSQRGPEHRPRTGTYRRHLELPKVIVVNAVSAGKEYPTGNSIAVTPKAPTKFHATVKNTNESSSQRSARQEPTVNVKVSDDNGKTNIAGASSGIVGNSNGASGSNIFSPTRSTLLLNSNATLFEQLRSTVAPLLNALGNRTPIFSTAFRDIANNSNSGPKITPSGSPPRFSARYKGAELFVRRPNVLEPAGPFLGSSTTPLAPAEDSGSAPPITVESPGEPKVITFYRSLESASITNEIEQTDSQQQRQQQQQLGSNAQVDARTTTDSDSNGTNNANNDTITTTTKTTTTTALPSTLVPINVTTVESITKDVSSITTIDTSQISDTTSQQDNTTATPNVATMTTDTTDTTTAVEGIVDPTSNNVTNEAPTAQSTATLDKVVETTPTGTPSSLQLDTTTVVSTTLGSVTTAVASTVMTETPMTQNDSSPRVTSISSPVGRIVYSETETPTTATTESADTTTSGSIGTTGIISETSIAQNLVDASLITDRPISEMDVVTTILPNSEVPPTTTIVTTTDGATGQSEEPETSNRVTTISGTTSPETTPSSIPDSTVDFVVQTATSNPESITPANPTSMVESMSPETTTTPILNATLEIVVQTVTPVPKATTETELIPTLEPLSLETTPTFAANSTLEVVVETASSVPETTQMTDANTIPVSTTSATTGFSAVSSAPPDSSSETPSSIFADITTGRMLEVEARFQDSTATSQVTEDEAVITSTPSIISTTDAEVTDISTRSSNPPETFESSTRGQSMLDMIRARIGNETDIPSLSDDSLLSRMMKRLMITLFSDSSEQTDSSSNSLNFNGNQTTTQSPKSPENAETTSSSSVEEVPQLLGGFLDNTDGNVTNNNLSLKDVTIGTTEIVETTPVIRLQSTQPIETTQSALAQTTSQPEVTTVVTTTPIIPPAVTSPLKETTLTPSATTEVANDQTETNAGPQQDVASTPAMDDTNVTTNQPPETTLTPSATVELLKTRLTNDSNQTNLMPSDDSVINNVTTTGYGQVMTNTTVPEITTSSIPVSSPDFSNENPNSLAGFQDTTTATAQRTAGDNAQATPQPEQTTISDSISPSSITTTPSTPGTTVTTTTGVPTTIFTTTTESPTTVPSTPTQLSTSSSANFNEMSTKINVESSQQTTTSGMTVVSTESTVQPISQSTGVTDSSDARTANTNATTELPAMATEATTMLMNDTSTNDITTSTTSPGPVTTTSSTTTPSTVTTQYLGRFGGSRITPAPRFSVSSSTKTPLRDYLVYGIFPNKTIVRKRPEDNLIDARNVDSPYVIFGIFPDGKLVRKFPNGTVIPDPPTNPVEVVFTLSTTTSTTNRPRPVFIDNQQANPVYNYNQNADLYNNRPTSILAGAGGQSGSFPSQINLGLSGNAIGPNGDGPASQPTATKMSDLLLNTQMGTALSASTKINGLLTDTLNPVTTSKTATVTPSNVNTQGGRFIQDRERDEASRSREAGGQRSTVYIGQEKFINYWTDGNSTKNNSRLVSVKINSVASALNESPSSISGSQPVSFDILSNNQSSGVDQVTAPPGFPWKDPLDQIFGITTQSSIITASIASNTLDDTNPSRSPIMSSTINPLVEVFSPLSAIAESATSPASTSTGTPDRTPAIAATTTAASKTTTTAAASPTTTTTTTTTTAAPKTTTTTFAPPTTTTTTTAAPKTTTTTTTPTTTTTTTTTAATTITTTVAPTTVEVPRQTAFGTTFDDLAFLNSLLQSPSVEATTPKTLTDVEQLLANKILSLALGNPGPTRSPKSIQSGDSSPNSVFSNPSPGPSSRPIIIDLLQTTSTTPKPIPTVVPVKQATWRPVSTTTPTVSTVKMTEAPTTTSTSTVASVRTTQKSQPTRKPKVTVVTTTPSPPRGFGAGILQALFGGNFFGIPVTTQKPVQITQKPIRTTPKPSRTTSLPIPTTQDQPLSVKSVHVTPRNVPTSKIQSNTPNSLATGFKPSVTPSTVETSTYSNEDAKFLAALLKAAERGNANGVQSAGIGNSEGVSNDDEAFLRSILNGQAASPNKPTVTTTTVETSTYSEEDDAKFLAALLKATDRGGGNGGLSAGIANSQGLSNVDEAFLRSILNGQASSPIEPIVTTTTVKTSTYSQADDAKFLAALLKAAERGGANSGHGTGATKSPGPSDDDESFLRAILNGQASIKPAGQTSLGTSDAALLASLLKSQGIEPSTPANRLREQLQSANVNGLQTTTRPTTLRPQTVPSTTRKLVPTKPKLRTTTWSPSSTYPPPLFSNFPNFGSALERPRGGNGVDGPAGDGSVRSQVFTAAIGATRAFSQFLGAAITGAAQQLQSFVRNGTRYVSQAAG